MEYREGKSIPVIMKEYQLETSWDPWTPITPSLPRPRGVQEAQNGLLNQAMVAEPEDFLTRFSPMNQTQPQNGLINQAMVSRFSPINQMQTQNGVLYPAMVRESEGFHTRFSSINQTQPQKQPLLSSSIERNMQNGSNFGDVSVNWRTMPNYGLVTQSVSDYPCLSSMDLALLQRNIGVKENVSMLSSNVCDDPFGQFDNMSFGDLLGMKGSVLEHSMGITRLGGHSGAVRDSVFVSSSSILRDQEALDLNQQVNGVLGQMENDVPIHQKWNLSSVNSTPVNKHTSGVTTTLAPPTPDLLWRKVSSLMSEKPNEQNRSRENKDVDVINNLKDLNNKEVASDSPVQVLESHNLDKGDLDLNKTPQQKKPRRKRYMPKVVRENKPKRTPNPKTPKARDSKDPQKPRRTFVRKGKGNKPSVSTPNEGAKTNDPKMMKPVANSCKKSLKFDLNGQVTEEDDEPNGGEEVVVETSEVGPTYDLNSALNQEVKDYIDVEQSSNSSPCVSSNEGVQTRGSKRGQFNDVGNANICEIYGIHFPGICKKRRTDKGQRSLTLNGQAVDGQSPPTVGRTPWKYCYSSEVPGRTDAVGENQVDVLMRNSKSKEQLLNTWVDISRLKKKRTKSITRVRDLTSLEGIASVSQVKSASRGARGRNSVYACIEALTEGVRVTPRSKGRTSSKSPERWDLVLYDGNQSMKTRRRRTTKAPLIKTVSLEAITEGLKLLNINKRDRKVSSRVRNALVPYRGKNKEQNALVPYANDGTLVPYEGPFDPIRKRRQRAKVELDDETTRVWRLLLENIDNEGIDGTDEEKAKWWENERGVFRGRVDSFIARMRLVQGDRRFTPWKGSVLDSVVGVFLTQNVSDHLSSSAFMSLAARFPIKTDSCETTLSEEGSSTLVVEQEVCVTEPEESISRNKSPDQPIYDQKSRVVYSIEEKEVVSSKEMSGTNKANSYTTDVEPIARDDATSSQQSVISSQNSVDSSNPSHHFNGSTSFLGLLKMAEAPFFNDSFSQIFGQDQPDYFKCAAKAKDSLEVPGISLSDYELYQKSDFHMKATTGIETIEVESITPNASTEQSNMTSGSNKDLTPRSSVSSCYVLEGEEMIMQSKTWTRKDSPDNIWTSLNVQNSSRDTVDVTESTTGLGGAHNKEAGPILKDNHASSGTHEEPAAKPKKGKGVKDKKNAYDWDELRKQTQVNGCKKERPANNRDSIDWEAVMRADVRVLAETIKERGMNNMLAERIKDLLDRLVKEHGSIDLEWLRDIPPDKAKEYLLSFRGLGLKSVECVRLLTLHHLAFPVDTNVGRIAVRLGWVPLQPLPEQLQLHLLELYPVLESIQKYLWPRLCKLDQKTLYELHYHMITFGKVFCTKRQPNCNACPLRGECRHFASAFASARLALPGPEERRIVPSAGGSSSNHVNPEVNINIDPLPLPLWSNHYTEINSRSNEGGPTVDFSSTQLSLSLPQPIHYLERNPQIDSEPIVEIPASPEPEPELEPAFCNIEDELYEDPNEIPTIKLNMKEFTQTLQNFMTANKELQETGMSRALVALTPEIASIPTPKLKNISRLRTEHHVYELPDTHPLLKGMDKRETDDPCSYLLAIWTPGETADSIQPPERRCNFDDPSILCNEETCSYCNSQREANSEIVRGTLLIPCRTAMRGSFPLNGTYFQVNEVFADHDSSLKPIEVPRSWLWNLPRRTVYFGTSVPTIFRGMSTEDIQHCFWRGYVCVRGFDQRTRAPRPLMARLHFPASRMPRGGKGKTYDDE